MPSYGLVQIPKVIPLLPTNDAPVYLGRSEYGRYGFADNRPSDIDLFDEPGPIQELEEHLRTVSARGITQGSCNGLLAQGLLASRGDVDYSIKGLQLTMLNLWETPLDHDKAAVRKYFVDYLDRVITWWKTATAGPRFNEIRTEFYDACPGAWERARRVQESTNGDVESRMRALFAFISGMRPHAEERSPYRLIMTKDAETLRRMYAIYHMK